MKTLLAVFLLMSVGSVAQASETKIKVFRESYVGGQASGAGEYVYLSGDSNDFWSVVESATAENAYICYEGRASEAVAVIQETFDFGAMGFGITDLTEAGSDVAQARIDDEENETTYAEFAIPACR